MDFVRNLLIGASALLVSVAATPSSVSKAPNPTSADRMNVLTGQIEGIGSFDGFRTARLSDGRWLSLTGDATRPGESLPTWDNAAIIWDSTGQRRIQTSHPGGHFFPRWSDGSEFWPGQFLVSGSTVYVIGSRQIVRGPYDWTSLGAWGAVLTVPSGQDPAFVRYFPLPSSWTDDTHVQWYAAISISYNSVYIHGVLDRPDSFHARDGAYVARVLLSTLTNVQTWTYWNGGGWTREASAAVPTIPIDAAQTDGTESGYTLHRRPNGQWQVTTKSGGTLADTFGRYVGPNPWGPWTWEPLMKIGSLESYLAGAAPTIPTTSGKLLVQWSRSDTYPKWTEVPS